MGDFISLGEEWYHITVASSDTLALYGPGSTFFSGGDPTNTAQQWQLFPYESFYVIRNKLRGPAVCIVTFGEDAGGDGGAPKMSNITESDESMFWKLSPWGDGGFYMTNAQSGFEWHLNVNPNFLIDMTNLTSPQDGQSYNLTVISDVNDVAFSTVNTPPGLILAAPTTRSATNAGSLITSAPVSVNLMSTARTTSPTATNTMSLPASSSLAAHHSGLSPAASGAIGALIATVVLLAAVITGFLFLRWKKEEKGKKVQAQVLSYENPNMMRPYELETNSIQIAQEVYVQPSEMEGGRAHAWELNGETI